MSMPDEMPRSPRPKARGAPGRTSSARTRRPSGTRAPLPPPADADLPPAAEVLAVPAVDQVLTAVVDDAVGLGDRPSPSGDPAAPATGDLADPRGEGPPPAGNAPGAPGWVGGGERAGHAVAGENRDLPGQEDDEGASASLVRPYSRTGGRTRPAREFEIEALVHSTAQGRDPSIASLLSHEHSLVIDLCRSTVSVAEVAAHLHTPIGVARVIIADMVDLGLVEVLSTSSATGAERDPAFLRRVLSGLQRL
jgi:hypothetical protein